MKTLYDNKLGTTIKEVFNEQDVIDLINSNEYYMYYLVSSPSRTNLWFNKAAAIQDIKERSEYMEIVHILTVNSVLIVEY